MKQRLFCSFDMARLVASLLIVGIHISPFSSISPMFDYCLTQVLSRVCVPLFLMITGYFVIPKAMQDWKYLKEYSWHIFQLYFCCSVLYFPIVWYARGTHFSDLFLDFFFQGTFYHLWYFPALLLGLWLTYFLLKKMKFSYVLGFSFVLYLIGLFGDSYYGLFSSSPLFSSFYSVVFQIFGYSRNGLFYVPIFLILGYLTRSSVRKVSKPFVFFGISMFVLVVEGMTLYYFQVPRHTSMYFSLPFVSYFLMCGLSKYQKGELLCFRKLSTFIYVMHPLVFLGVRFGLKLLHFENLLLCSLFVYFLVIVITIVCFYLILFLKEVVLYGLRIIQKSGVD